jgi:hypothetical protein
MRCVAATQQKKNVLNVCEFRENRHSETHTLQWEMNFNAYFSLFVKFRIGGLHVMLIIIREFRENRNRESRTCHTVVNKVILQLCVYSDGRGLRNLKSEEPGS